MTSPIQRFTSHLIPIAMVRPWTLILLFASALPAPCDDMRVWKSADGTRTVQAEFIKWDGTAVTIRNQAGKEFVVELCKLHPDERKWLETSHSLACPAPVAASPPAPDPAAFFDNLTFRDTRQSVLPKLKASTIVEMTADEAFIGRTGVNGIFHIRQKVGELDGSLYFDWSEAGRLTELNLQYGPVPAASYPTALETTWRLCGEQLGALHGTALVKKPLPAIGSVADGSFMPSHIWKLATGGFVELGTAREGPNYQVVVRYMERNPMLFGLP